MKARDKIVIAFPHGGSMDPDLGVNLFALGRQRGERIEAVITVGGLGLLARTRNVICQQFLDGTAADWLLMIDTDELLTLETFDKLVEAADAQTRPVISGLVFAAYFDNDNTLTPVPCIFRLEGERGLQPIHDYTPGAVIPIDAAGTGCLLIHRRVLDKMRDTAAPDMGTDWAFFFDGPIGGRWVSEDIIFSRRIQQLGYKLHAATGAVLPHRKHFLLDDRWHRGWLAGSQTG